MKTLSVKQIVALAALIGAGQGCVDPIDTGQDVGLHVAEVVAPATAPASGPITVTLTVALNGCEQFGQIAASGTPNSIILAARGTIQQGTACPDIVRHETHSHTASGPFTDPVVVTVFRPTTDPLVRDVRIQ